jgi:hypothetical protein
MFHISFTDVGADEDEKLSVSFSGVGGNWDSPKVVLPGQTFEVRWSVRYRNDLNNEVAPGTCDDHAALSKTR